MRKYGPVALIVLLVLAWAAPSATAQAQPTLKLSLRRDFGYGGFGQIQGLFTLTASGPADLQHVTFLIDGQVMGEASAAPFRFQFNTSSYPLGTHTLSATGTTAGGLVLQSNQIQEEFVSAGAAGSGIPIAIYVVIGVVLAIIAARIGSSILVNRRRGKVPLGQPRNYGIAGGAICPKCGRPFPIPLLSMNMGFSKLTQCPHCGKWVRVQRSPLEELRAAEAAELKRAEGETQLPQPEEEKEAQRKALDESRYEDS